MEPMLIDLLKVLAPIILGGSAWVGVGQYKKARAEARLTEVEARKLDNSIGPSNVALSAEAMREAISTMRDIAADANASRERAEAAERTIRVELANEREQADLLWRRVRALEDSERSKDRQLVDHKRRISRLENKLTSAKHLVENLAVFIQAQQNTTGEVPVIDYSIFEP